MDRIPTEIVLQKWRYGQVQSERLCAELLHIEGFESVDPQCPLGGSDGLKDVLCTKDGEKWITAATFPPTPQKFNSIKDKFSDDLEGIMKNDASGIVFFVNQPLTLGHRSTLISTALPHKSEIYHLERIRSILDSPKGYGIRLEYLRISMTKEEQLGFFSIFKDELVERFTQQEQSINKLHRKMDTLMMQTSAPIGYLVDEPSSLLPLPDLKEDLEFIHFPTARLAIGQLCWLHRMITDGTRLPKTHKGHLRSVAVWIGPSGGSYKEARFIPPPPEEVLTRTTALLKSWRERYPALVHAKPEDILEEITAFHHGLLSIHPFLDANGRVAIIILQQQVLELLRRTITLEFTAEPRIYYDALRRADEGDRNDLKDLIHASLD